MSFRVFSGFAVVVGICALTVQAFAIEDAASRRERLQREARKYPQQASEALQKKDADEAIKLFTKAIESGAFKSEKEMLGQLHFGRGVAYRMKGDCPTALQDFDTAAALITKGDLFFMRGACYLDLKQEDKALADFDAAIQVDPEASAYRSARCITLFNRKNFAGALPDCEKALAAAPDDKSMLLAASQSAEQIGNRARAAELYRKLLSVNPGDPVASEGLKRVGG